MTLTQVLEDALSNPVPLHKVYVASLSHTSNVKYKLETLQGVWKFLHLVQTELAVEQYLTCHIILDKVAITKKSTDNDSVSETSIGRGTWGFGCGPNRVFEVFRDLLLMIVGDSLPADFCPHEILGLSLVLKKDSPRIELHTNCDSTPEASIDDVFIFGLVKSIRHLYFKVHKDEEKFKRVSRVATVSTIKKKTTMT